MKKEILLIFFLFFAFPVLAQYSVTGGSGTPLLAVNNARERIQVYMLNGLSDARISYTSSGEEVHQWYKYREKASEAIPVSSQQNGNTSFITGVEDGYGYYVGPATSMSTSYVWMIDYSKYVPSFFSLSIEESEDKCDNLKIVADVEAEPLHYYTSGGAPVPIERVYHLQYSTLNWDESSLTFIENNKGTEWKGLISEIVVDAPLKNTDFVLTGDSIAEHFGLQQKISTPVYPAIAVQAHGWADRYKEGQEDIHTGPPGKDLGGSAPIDITFTAYANEPVAAYYIWTVIKYVTSKPPETKVRYTDKVLRYPFTESGNYKVKLEVFGSPAVCVDTTQVFDVNIGESKLKIPNAFTPGSSPGINDVFKVSYQSIISFKASIFNRWGNLLYTWDDPDGGWDGRVNGKYVAPGVYFYMIEAKGADGKSYKESGDINILRSKY